MDTYWKGLKGAIIPYYPDTTTANTALSHVDSIGSLIMVKGIGSIIYYFRDSVYGGTGHKWTQVGSGGGSGNTIYTADDALAANRTVSMNDKTLTFLDNSTHFNQTFAVDLENTSPYGTRGLLNVTISSASLQAADASHAGWVVAETGDANIHAIHNANTSQITVYGDSINFHSPGLYRFDGLPSQTDTSIYHPVVALADGKLGIMSSWPGASFGHNLFGRNGLRARNDSTITWNGLLDTATLINGSATYSLRFSGISGGVKFDENPTFNTVSVTGQVWTAANSSGLGQWQTPATNALVLVQQTVSTNTTQALSSGDHLLNIDVAPASNLSNFIVGTSSGASDVVPSTSILASTGSTFFVNTTFPAGVTLYVQWTGTVSTKITMTKYNIP
jgi:hypothetical protein